jgi:hypothetical protein
MKDTKHQYNINKEDLEFIQQVLHYLPVRLAPECGDINSIAESNKFFLDNGGSIYCVARCNEIIRDTLNSL